MLSGDDTRIAIRSEKRGIGRRKSEEKTGAVQGVEEVSKTRKRLRCAFTIPAAWKWYCPTSYKFMLRWWRRCFCRISMSLLSDGSLLTLKRLSRVGVWHTSPFKLIIYRQTSSSWRGRSSGDTLVLFATKVHRVHPRKRRSKTRVVVIIIIITTTRRKPGLGCRSDNCIYRQPRPYNLQLYNV